MQRTRLLLGIVLYAGLIAYEYAPFAYKAHGSSSFPSGHLLLVGAIIVGIGVVAAHPAILALPWIQIFVWAIAHDNGSWGSSFALLEVILWLPAITFVMTLGVFLGRFRWRYVRLLHSRARGRSHTTPQA